MVPSGSRVLVAVSGGSDSTALVLALVERGGKVMAAHFDHRLRADSETDVAAVGRLCQRLGVPLITGSRQAPLGPGSVQAAARSARYGFLESARLRSGSDLIALGHTADDAVEGVALHLLRGSGLAGMRGMPARRGVFVRPLLEVWKADVIAYLEARGESWVQDRSNLDFAYARVRVRLWLLPALEADRPGIVRRMRKAAREAGRLQERLEGEAATFIGGVDATQVPATRLAATSQPLRAEVFRQLYHRAGGPMPGLNRRHLDALGRLPECRGGSMEVHLPGKLVCKRSGDTLSIAPKAGAVSQPALKLVARSCPGCDEPAAAHLKFGLSLELQYRTPGLRMRPAGGRGTRKLQDILVDARVPRAERDFLPLVFADSRLAWVPGVAIDEDAAARPGQWSQHVTIELAAPGPRNLPEQEEA